MHSGCRTGFGGPILQRGAAPAKPFRPPTRAALPTSDRHPLAWPRVQSQPLRNPRSKAADAVSARAGKSPWRPQCSGVFLGMWSTRLIRRRATL
jgi:hypothetical protein